MTPLAPIRHDLVLAGGGHAHVEVLRALAMKPVPGLRVTLISRSRTAIYSGMVPGYVAGQYDLDEISVNLDRLCVLGGHRFIMGEIEGLDPVAQTFALRGRPALGFDTASINVGSTPDLAAIPGAAEHATPVKPIEGFARHFADWQAETRARSIAIVGGGAGGVELALALSARLDQRAVPHLIDHHPSLLSKLPPGAGRWAQKRMEQRGVSLHLGQRVTEITADGPRTQALIPADLTLLVTGSKAPRWIEDSGLSCDERGFMRVGNTLQSRSHPAIFGAGDCVNYDAFPREKAGVFAVRAGPGLADNVRRLALDATPVPTTMQQRGLQLIGDGAGAACAIWGPFVLSAPGRALFRWKDHIDRLWMDRYNHFGAAMVAAMEAQPETMRCSGCGGKVGPEILRDTMGELAVSGDVAALSEAQVGSVDLIRDAFDDPYLFARIAGIHALSDLYAAGATNPRMLSALTLPYAKPAILRRDLEQLKNGLVSLGVPVIGGHTAEGAELTAALTVVGDKAPAASTRARVGDALILTKPLGVGLILAGRMLGKVHPHAVETALKHCEQDNAQAARILEPYATGLRTDVTGFGLLGHLQTEVPDGLGACVSAKAIPLLPGALDAFRAGIRPTILDANQRATAQALCNAPSPEISGLLHDPQTSGGLVVSVAQSDVEAVLAALHAAGYDQSAWIGRLTSREPATDTGWLEVIDPWE